MENCDTMWSINKNFQTITMRMCIETVMPVLLEYNITNLTIPSLHNATLNSTKKESFTGNILNQTNITNLTIPSLYNATLNSTKNESFVGNILNQPNYTLPSLNTNSSKAKVNLTSPSSSIIFPSPSPESWILTSIVPSSSEPVETSPSPTNSPSSYIRGSVSPSAFMINSTDNETHKTEQPYIDEISTPLSIVLLSCGIICTLLLLWGLYRRKTRTNKIQPCPSRYKYKKPVLKTTNLNRPTDYILEHLTPSSTPKTQPAPPKEEREDRDIDGKTALE